MPLRVFRQTAASTSRSSNLAAGPPRRRRPAQIVAQQDRSSSNARISAGDKESTNNRSFDDDLTTIDDTCAGTFARMSNEADEVRCAGCGRLLAKLRDGRLSVQRGELQATFDG